MLNFVETGLANYFRKKITVDNNPCQADVKPMGKMSAYNLKNFTPAFFLFGIGLVFSLIIFLLELIIFKSRAYYAKIRLTRKKSSIETIAIQDSNNV